MHPSRRAVLRWGLAGAGLLTLGGVGLGLRPGATRPSNGPLRVLTPRAYATLAAVADRICPGTDAAPSASDLHVADQVDALLASMDPGQAGEVVQLLHLFDNAVAGLLFDGRPVPFSRAAPAAQDAALEAWRTSSLSFRRMAYKALRGLVASTWYADPRTYAASGYPGPPDFSAWAPPSEAP